MTATPLARASASSSAGGFCPFVMITAGRLHPKDVSRPWGRATGGGRANLHRRPAVVRAEDHVGVVGAGGDLRKPADQLARPDVELVGHGTMAGGDGGAHGITLPER